MNKSKQIRNIVWIGAIGELTYVFIVLSQALRWFHTGNVVYVDWGDLVMPVAFRQVYETVAMVSPVFIVLFWQFNGTDFYDMMDLPFFEWPASFIVRFSWLIVVSIIATFPTMLGFVCRYVILAWLAWQSPVWFFRPRRGLAKQPALVNDTDAIQDEVTTKQPAAKDEGKCSICQQESLYDVCLACEKRYQGEIQRLRGQLRRAKKANAPASLTLAEWLATLKHFNWKCAYCQVGKYQVLEHYVPISAGGGTTAENCVPACFKCNSQKSNEDPGL